MKKLKVGDRVMVEGEVFGEDTRIGMKGWYKIRFNAMQEVFENEFRIHKYRRPR